VFETVLAVQNQPIVMFLMNDEMVMVIDLVFRKNFVVDYYLGTPIENDYVHY
jgi:hypothetical protein